MAKITVLPGIVQQFDVATQEDLDAIEISGGGLTNAQRAKFTAMEAELLQARLDIVGLKQQVKGLQELFEGNRQRLGFIDAEIQKLGGASYTDSL